MVGARRRAPPDAARRRWVRSPEAACASGLEDSIYLGKGRLAESNAEQVAKIVRILRELSLEIATPEEARRSLCLKGPDNTRIT